MTCILKPMIRDLKIHAKYNGIKINETSLKGAIAFLEKNELIHAPTLFVSDNGVLTLQWDNKQLYFTVEFKDDQFTYDCHVYNSNIKGTGTTRRLADITKIVKTIRI